MTELDPMLPRVAHVRRRRRDGPEVWTLEIELDDEDGAGFEPGQFNMLTAFGVGEVPISLSGDAAKLTPLTHTIRAVGAVSTALAMLGPGKPLGLRGPFGVGWPMKEVVGNDVIVVAGGLGLAPLRPVIYHLTAMRERYGRIILLYGARGPSDLLFRREIESWRRRLHIEIEVIVDHAIGDWHGHVGTVPTLIPRIEVGPANTVAMVCGPEIMMRFTVAALRDAGLPESAIYLSMERNMKCAVGFCGHCQYGPVFVCKDGPVFRYDRIGKFLRMKEI